MLQRACARFVDLSAGLFQQASSSDEDEDDGSMLSRLQALANANGGYGQLVRVESGGQTYDVPIHVLIQLMG